MIWTPNNKLADPVCRRCGGLDRQWLRVHRHHAGMSFHRACCCVVEPLMCAATTGSVTFSGITKHPDCFNLSGGISSNYDFLAVNGSYPLVRGSVFGLRCNFGIDGAPVSGSFGQQDMYSGAACSTFDNSVVYDTIDASDMAVSITEDTSVVPSRWIVNAISFDISTTPSAWVNHAFAYKSTADAGAPRYTTDDIPNQNAAPNIGIGGTARLTVE